MCQKCETWVSDVDLFSDFKGKFQHSREYRRPTEYAGQRVLVLGSGNSGSDIVRHLALLNTDHYQPSSEPHPNQTTPPPLPFTTVYHSVTGANRGGYNAPTDPWTPYIRTVTLISHITPDSRIHLTDGTVLEDIDTIIFATGYNNSLPFAKVTDEPWKSRRVLDGVISLEEREKGGDESEIGGQKGLHMTGLDELLLFLKDDRTISFPGLRTSRVYPHSMQLCRWRCGDVADNHSIPNRTIPILRSPISSIRITLGRSSPVLP